MIDIRSKAFDDILDTVDLTEMIDSLLERDIDLNPMQPQDMAASARAKQREYDDQGGYREDDVYVWPDDVEAVRSQAAAMRIKQAQEWTGGVPAENTKIPGPVYGISTSCCHVGTKLAQIEGSVCADCYAKSGAYELFRSNVDLAHDRRRKSMNNPTWVPAMVRAIRSRAKGGYFRWHDSGDIVSDGHLANIALIAKALPEVQFWLPTKEYGLVRRYLRNYGPFPENLHVRVSAAMIGDFSPPVPELPSSHVVMPMVEELEQVPDTHVICPATKPIKYDPKNPQHFTSRGTCDTCRACWDSNVRHIVYVRHNKSKLYKDEKGRWVHSPEYLKNRQALLAKRAEQDKEKAAVRQFWTGIG